MALNARRPALVLLAGALWLGGAGPTWADPPINANELTTFLTAVQNRVLNARSPSALGGVSIQSAASSAALARLRQQDQQLQQQSARITQRLNSLNSLLANSQNPRQVSAVQRLERTLQRQEAVLTQRIQTVQQRINRGAATPSAPGGF